MIYGIILFISQELNMDLFAEQFKTKAQGAPADLSKVKVKVAEKAPSKVSLLEANKAKNLAITLRKGGMSPDAICTAIETYVPYKKRFRDIQAGLVVSHRHFFRFPGTISSL